jgi:hypothetical protein
MEDIDVEGVVKFVSALQQPDGSFYGDEWGEVDNRFSFCAVACLALLGIFLLTTYQGLYIDPKTQTPPLPPVKKKNPPSPHSEDDIFLSSRNKPKFTPHAPFLAFFSALIATIILF